MATVELLSPVGGTQGRWDGQLAPRGRDLQGRVVGLLDNSKPNADLLLDRIGRLLRAKYGAGDVVKLRKAGAGVPLDQESLERLAATCDLVVTGTGD